MITYFNVFDQTQKANRVTYNKLNNFVSLIYVCFTVL